MKEGIMTDTTDKYELRRKIHGGLVFFGMIVNFLVIGAIFYFVLTREENPKPPAFMSGKHYLPQTPQERP